MAHAITHKRSTYKRQKGFTCSSVNMHISSRQTGRSKETEMLRIQLEKTSPAWQGKREIRSARERAQVCREKSLPLVSESVVFQKKMDFLCCLKVSTPAWEGEYIPFSVSPLRKSPLLLPRTCLEISTSPWIQCGPRGRRIHRQSSDQEVKAFCRFSMRFLTTSRVLDVEQSC